tara:strand:- start:42 stop:539 length:498 start_codon:yes stop_codon:yes gene_type:complete
MKLLFENWRVYLLENKNWGDWTVAELDELISMSRREEESQANSLLSRLFGIETIKLIPFLGNALTFGEMAKQYISKKNRTPEGIDALEDFPVLKILQVDLHLVETIEDDILDKVDDEYQEYLQSLDSDMKLSQIKDINDYIREYIARETLLHVVISDNSGDMPSA